MRWTEKQPTYTNEYYKQTWFALVPYTIHNETRWMEYVTVEFRRVIEGNKIVYYAVRFL